MSKYRPIQSAQSELVSLWIGLDWCLLLICFELKFFQLVADRIWIGMKMSVLNQFSDPSKHLGTTKN